MDLIERQAAIDAICAVCGNDCDKSEFVYNAPQDEQVILCPEHYCLCTLPSAQPQTEIIRCKDCKHRHLDGMIWNCPFGLSGGEDFFCAYGAKDGDSDDE